MAAVTVLADQAIQGHFPEVCAKTGRPANGSMTVTAKVGGLWRNKLVIRLPWSEGARLGGIGVELDATQRWVILDGVHPDFVAAVLAHNDPSSSAA